MPSLLSAVMLSAFCSYGDIVSTGENAVTIDTQGGVVTISEVISGTTDVTITGRGDAIFSVQNTHTGKTTIEQGVLKLASGYVFSGALAIGANGALAVDVSSIDKTSAGVGDKIELFSAPLLLFEFEDDTLDDSVFLYGPAILYTLSSEILDGIVHVYATITDVSRISQTCKTTTFIQTDNYIDQPAPWTNGMPAQESLDTIIFCADATMHVYSKAWGLGNNLSCRTMAIRGATVLADHPDNWNPCLDKNRVVGNGTLQLRR